MSSCRRRRYTAASVLIVFAALQALMGETGEDLFKHLARRPWGRRLPAVNGSSMTVTTEVFPTIVPRSAAPPSAHLRLAIAAAGCPGFAGR
ncbi:exported protein of unknown function [Agrobacterium pusense]|uniref:Transposase n=1 Tax=Agrobacterium pusense TaxID=648995 RepID=U4QC34_9HYPH|nr:exported protein of unknown function [Agrobacterium pusense]